MSYKCLCTYVYVFDAAVEKLFGKIGNAHLLVQRYRVNISYAVAYLLLLFKLRQI